MSSGVTSAAKNNASTASNLSNQLTANAASVYGGLEPQLQAEAAAPSGYTPTQKAAMNTAAQQSAGGGNAGAEGQARLYAARTNNAGGAKAAIGAATRGSGANLSNAAVGTEVQNANLQQKQRQAGLSGLSNLNQTETSAGEGALGLSDQALGVANDAYNNNPWIKTLQTAMQSAGQGAGMAVGCWIAAELYGGWDDPRTIAVRKWIFTDFAKSRLGRIVCALYLKCGERTAELIRKHPMIRKPFLALFDRALRKAGYCK